MPITPDEASRKKAERIPPEVFAAFDELIAERFNGYSASFTQEDVVKRIVEKTGAAEDRVYAEHWLDVEPAYRAAGWGVEYDKPGYNEPGPAVFKFSRT